MRDASRFTTETENEHTDENSHSYISSDDARGAMLRVDVDVDEKDAAAAEKKFLLQPLANGKHDDATRDDDATEGKT